MEKKSGGKRTEKRQTAQSNLSVATVFYTLMINQKKRFLCWNGVVYNEHTWNYVRPK